MRILQIGTNKGNVDVEDIPGKLRDMQGVVGGHIETVPMPQLNEKGIALVANEEGLLQGLPTNENLFPFFFVGQMFMVGISGTEFISLTDEQLDYCRAWLSGLRE